jgi:aryl-alcohol dehydrogenase-like predicted oxidoreductase
MVGAIGLGCMSFAGVFGETDEATSHACLDCAYEMGITFLDTANVYGMGRSETVLGSWLKKARRDVVLATKVGIQRDAKEPVNNRPDHIRAEIEG